jgi:hypothetical protein
MNTLNTIPQNLINQYIDWLRDKTSIRQINGWLEITTPFVDRHNDYLQIYAKQENDRYLLMDDGYIIEDLKQSGCNLDSIRRQEILKMILSGFNAQLDNDALVTYASIENFSVRKHSLIQAMLAADDLFYLASPTVASLFYEDIAAWLDASKIRYIPKVKFTGQSGYDHLFDFVIPKSDIQPERVVHAFNRPNRENVELFAFSWVDTKDARPVDSRAYAFLNDSEYVISAAVFDALRNYDVRPVPWSQREEVRNELAA